MDPETPEADAAEQAREAAAPAEENEIEPLELSAEANPADLAEQHVVVPEEDPYERG